VSARRLAAWLCCIVPFALVWPAGAAADHLVTNGSVSARLVERRAADLWTVEISWTAACIGITTLPTWYAGNLFMFDETTQERLYVGAVVDTSGARAVSGRREWVVAAIDRSRRLTPLLDVYCYENSPLHGAPHVEATGAAVVIPPRFRGGTGGGGGGGGGGDYGTGDPTAPLGSGGCGLALAGTSKPDRLTGGDAGEVIFGFGGGDRIRAGGGHDCAIGGKGNDRLLGELGNDRLTGGRGNDLLVGGRGVNGYDGGPGRDRIEARNGKRELVRCGSGRDLAVIDRRDRVRDCERVRRPPGHMFDTRPAG
jgi:RTX calcium-binding nonapeptide repeat (4 copies)